MLPVDEVTADRVAPTHVPPFVAEGVVLIEKMVLPIMVDQTVWIVHPVSFGCEMELRPEGLLKGCLHHCRMTPTNLLGWLSTDYEIKNCLI
jgi:hypothetical protein